MSATSDVLIVIFFLFSFKKVKSEKKLWTIFIYCSSSLLLNYIGEQVLPYSYKYVFYTLFTLFEYLLFSYFLILAIKSRLFHRIMYLAAVFFILFIICYLIVARNQRIDSLSIGIETILIIVYSFYFLWEQMNNTSTLFIYSKYEFWIITGLLIYLAGSFFIYIYANQIDEKFIYNYWFLTNVFYITKNIFFAIGIFNYIKKFRKQTYPSKKFTPFLS